MVIRIKNKFNKTVHLTNKPLLNRNLTNLFKLISKKINNKYCFWIQLKLINFLLKVSLMKIKNKNSKSRNKFKNFFILTNYISLLKIRIELMTQGASNLCSTN